MTLRYYHYTTHIALEGILLEGVIHLATEYVPIGEMAAVWFSSNPKWEETVRKSFIDCKTKKETGPLSRDDLFQRDVIPVRLGLNPECINNGIHLVSWKTYRKRRGISKKLAVGFEKTALDWGANPKEWRASFKPVPFTAACFTLEFWDGQKWVIGWAIGVDA